MSTMDKTENVKQQYSNDKNLSARIKLHLKHFNPDTKAFTQEVSFNLQNGYEILSGHFSKMERMDYEDSLSITETQDLVDWMKSTISIASYSEKDLDGLFDYFEDIRKKYGAINVEKECGLFISIK